jgi:CBS domain-containing protein
MKLNEIMSQPARKVRASASVQQAAEIMGLHDVGALPVCEDDVLVGILTDRDIIMRCIAPGMDTNRTEVREIMTANPIALPPEAPLEDAAQIFTDLRIRRLPVVDGTYPVGMVTVDDITRQWDNEAGIVRMARRVAPRSKRKQTAA